MNFTVTHELPGRLRLALSSATGRFADREQVETQFRGLAGIIRIHFSPRTHRLLILFDPDRQSREHLLRRVADVPLPRRRKPGPKSELEQKQAIAIRAGMLLLFRPLIPLPIRPILSTWGSLPFLKKGLVALGLRRIDVDVLDSAALGAALTTGEFGTASVISFLLKLGDFLDEWARGRSRHLLAEMFQVGEEWAWIEREGSEVRVPTSEVAQGDLLVIRMGSLIPVDGIVSDGEALVNQSSLTGEGQPVWKSKGAPVFAGTAIEEGRLRVRATQVGGETRAARIVRLIEAGELLKAETQQRSERLADKIVPFSFLLSGLVFGLTGNANRAAAVLLVDYSCAIKLSTPLTFLAAMAKAAKNRVLIKGGGALEKLARADAFLLDKTGTLTLATPKVMTVQALPGFDDDYILRQVACVEEHFPHPVAVAVVSHATERGLKHPEEHAEVEYILAHGIVSWLHGERILVGSRHFIHEDEGIDIAEAEPFIETFAARGETILYVAIGRQLAGLISIHDPLRPEAVAFVDRLRQAGVARIVMLTGDNEATARTVAARLHIDAFQAEAYPEAKVAAIKRLQREGYTVAMVGDGINDSPALTHADVGISMKHGAEIAQESCDVLLLDGHLDDLLAGRRIAREAMVLIEENFRQIVAVNSVAMLLAISGLLPPIFSALLHNLGTISTGVKALRPLRES